MALTLTNYLALLRQSTTVPIPSPTNVGRFGTRSRVRALDAGGGTSDGAGTPSGPAEGAPAVTGFDPGIASFGINAMGTAFGLAPAASLGMLAAQTLTSPAPTGLGIPGAAVSGIPGSLTAATPNGQVAVTART